MAKFRSFGMGDMNNAWVRDNNRYTFPQVNAGGSGSHVQGNLRCETCGTGNPVKGRPGQVLRDYKYNCRSCKTPHNVVSISFACNN